MTGTSSRIRNVMNVPDRPRGNRVRSPASPLTTQPAAKRWPMPPVSRTASVHPFQALAEVGRECGI